MNGIRFQDQAPVVAAAPFRADVALLAGFVGRRPTPLPDDLRAWLTERGWATAPYRRGPLEELLDLPVPIDSWDRFDQLFAWDARPIGNQGRLGGTYLGAAVRSFFSQGGRRCYVVRAGDPSPIPAPRGDRLAALGALLPGYPGGVDASPADQISWRGLGHLYGLPDVSFVCLPDLPDVVAADLPALPLEIPAPAADEQFVECSGVEPAGPVDRGVHGVGAPRCDEQGYLLWARAVNLAGDLIARRRREVQLVAAVPLPATGTAAERDLLAALLDGGRGPLAFTPGRHLLGLASAFIQLAYPWIRTRGSARLPEGLEAPDGALTGALARSVLSRGVYRSAANLPLAEVYDVYPALRRDQTLRPYADTRAEGAAQHTLQERVSLVGPTLDGWAVLSDVTTSLSESYRPACVNRLVAAIVRAARVLGEDLAFEPSGEGLWAQVRSSLSALMLHLLEGGALRGATPDEAFQVSCDRSTMTQNDIDNGRVVAYVRFDAAVPIERITVVLALDNGGQFSLLPSDPGEEVPHGE